MGPRPLVPVIEVASRALTYPIVDSSLFVGANVNREQPRDVRPYVGRDTGSTRACPVAQAQRGRPSARISRACFCWCADPFVDHLPDLLAGIFFSSVHVGSVHVPDVRVGGDCFGAAVMGFELR